ncbi:unnamed protein product [Arctia plantaginis]|uniref:Uncharacterized protein n=1 Tax=Arctia plantaginis TaxID=874455 RepID=A0A8S0YNV0_ARCPL|nr:unnamed protein product [Arctia plantaginis]
MSTQDVMFYSATMNPTYKLRLYADLPTRPGQVDVSSSKEIQSGFTEPHENELRDQRDPEFQTYTHVEDTPYRPQSYRPFRYLSRFSKPLLGPDEKRLGFSILLKVMAPRQDLVAQPQPIRIEQGRQPPPPPAPGRHQRPPHDNPTVYINSPVVAMPRNNVSRREITRT